MSKIYIVSTTIHGPAYVLEHISTFDNDNISRDNYRFIVIGDEIRHSEWNQINMDYDCVEYVSIEDEEKYLRELVHDKEDWEFIAPHRSPYRRNLGYLIALKYSQSPEDVTIAIDDDNLSNQNLIKCHLGAFNKNTLFSKVSSNNKIINPIRCLSSSVPFVYSRGYPINEYFRDSFDFNAEKEFPDNEVMINLGLWNNCPDTDSMTHLVNKNDINVRSKNVIEHYLVDKGNYMPLNTQNIAIKGELRKIFWNIRVPKLYQYSMDRYDDIWGGLFTYKVMETFGYMASFGSPYLEHRRNYHDFLKDFRREWFSSILNIRLWDFIMNTYLEEKKDVLSAYTELAEKLVHFIDYSEPNVNTVIRKIGKRMLRWVSIVERL